LALILLIDNASLKFLLDMHFCRQTCLLKPQFSNMKFRIKDVVEGGREEATFFVSVKVKVKKNLFAIGRGSLLL